MRHESAMYYQSSSAFVPDDRSSDGEKVQLQNDFFFFFFLVSPNLRLQPSTPRLLSHSSIAKYIYCLNVLSCKCVKKKSLVKFTIYPVLVFWSCAKKKKKLNRLDSNMRCLKIEQVQGGLVRPKPINKDNELEPCGGFCHKWKLHKYIVTWI